VIPPYVWKNDGTKISSALQSREEEWGSLRTFEEKDS